MRRCAGCCFNKAHAFACALLSYQTAYLKANHPQQYMTALLETEKSQDPRHSSYPQYLAEANRIGVKI